MVDDFQVQAARRMVADIQASDGETVSVREWMSGRVSAGRDSTNTTFSLHNSERAREIRNDLSTQDGSQGGYLRGSTLADIVEINLLGGSAMRSVATVVRSETQRGWIPIINDAQAEGYLVAPNSSLTVADPAFEGRLTNGTTFGSGAIRVPNEMLTDNPQTAGALNGVLARRIARRQNRSFTVGMGTGEPMGIVTACQTGKTAASATAFTVAEVIDLIGAVDPSYSESGSGRLMMHPLVLAYLRKIVDANGVYAFEASGLARIPRVLNPHMPSTLAAGNRVVLFGDFASAYQIRDASELRLTRSLQRYAEQNQSLFHAYQMADGAVVDPYAVQALQLAAS